MKVDIAILTLREDEFTAVRRCFQRTERRRMSGGRTYVIAEVKTEKHTYTIAIARASEQGTDAAQRLTQYIIHELDPQFLLVVGIAGGIPSDEFTLGDVVVSTSVANLHVDAWQPDGTTEYTTRGGPTHPLVENIVSLLPGEPHLAGWADSIQLERPRLDPEQANITGDDEWRERVRQSLNWHFGEEQKRGRPSLFTVGPILSSTHLIRDPARLREVLKTHRSLVAVEMESAGIYEAAQAPARQYPIMVIRGISDIVGLQRDRRWTAYACEAAAAFTYAFIRSSPLDPRIESPASPIQLFYSYCQRDEKMREQLEIQLGLLRHQHFLESWRYRRIDTDQVPADEVDDHIDSAQIMLLLVSSDFLASGYSFGLEVRRMLQRHESGEARVIPIILRPTLWQTAPFGQFLALPPDGKPVTSWPDTTKVWADIAQALRFVCKDLQASRGLVARPTAAGEPDLNIYQLYEVFIKSGVPHVTFVKREDFGRLKLALAQPGRGVIIEGPSGVGKTTAIKKAIEELADEQYLPPAISATGRGVQLLSARDPEHRARLRTLRDWHHDTVIIDDFHRLSPGLREDIVDYLKYLADTEASAKKLVIVGIPHSGQTLADISFDIATRVDVFHWGKVKDELVMRMIEQGEKALNIVFDQKIEIVLAASGSFNIAQYLCFHFCEKAGVKRTQDQELARIVNCDVNAAVSDVMAIAAQKFGESIRRFVALGGHQDTICLRLLEELAQSDDGLLSLHLLKKKKRELARGIERFIGEKWMDGLYQDYPACMYHLFFDPTSHLLAIDDPQLTFYLNRVQFTVLAREAGKVLTDTQQRIFISYSHKDARWLKRLQVHLRPLEREGVIDLWDDTKIAAGTNWREAIETAIESSTAAVILVSADFLASEFISEYELPTLLLRAQAGGTIILPLIVAPCYYVGSRVEVFQAINSPNKPLTEMTSSERERTFVKLAEAINKRFEA
jgi:nucleoside phosphorylase